MFIANERTHEKRGLVGVAIGALLAIVATSIYLTWPYSFRRQPPPVAQYPAPIAASQIDGNPTIQGVAVGQLPEGFPADLPLHQSKEIVQAYRSFYPDRPGYNAVAQYTTSATPSDVIRFYEQWAVSRGWSTARQPASDPKALYATTPTESLIVTVVRSSAGVKVGVNYASRY
jgi:hypothetical protein